MEFGVAIGLGIWFAMIGIVAMVRVFKDYKE